MKYISLNNGYAKQLCHIDSDMIYSGAKALKCDVHIALVLSCIDNLVLGCNLKTAHGFRVKVKSEHCMIFLRGRTIIIKQR